MLLVIDTSGPLCSAALFDIEAETLAGEMSEDLGRGHAERLMPMLEELLADADLQWQDITRLGVVNGPGSFTGLRVGLATARGLALALTQPCNTLSVFEAFDEQFGNTGVLGVVIDARRDQIWMQCFENNVAITAPQAATVGDIADVLPDTVVNLVGSAAAEVAKRLDHSVTVLSEAASPSIAAAARRIASQPVANKKPKALYLRAPDAKPQTPLRGKA